MHRSLVALSAALLLSPALACAQDLTRQEMILRAKPAVVIVVAEVAARVPLRCGGVDKTVSPEPYRESGSGFFVSPRGWVLTNAHVVFVARQPPRRWMTSHLTEKAFRAECLPQLLSQRGLAPGDRPEVEEELVRQAIASTPADQVALEPGVFLILQNGMRLRATIAKYNAPAAGDPASGRDLALLRVEASDMPALAFGDSDGVKIGDTVSVIGFPNVVMTHELIGASARAQATVTHGAVSGFRQNAANQPVMQTDAAAEAGTSGGPVLSSAGAVVGVMTFATQGEGGAVQGFNVVIPAAAVRGFLADTTVALDEPSRFNAAWYAGLSEFFRGRYSRAAGPLAEANRLLPEVPDVLRITAENAAQAKTQPWLPWAQVGAALVLAAFLGYVALLWRKRQRNLFRISPSEVARLLEGTDPPAILDVREPTAYARSPVRIPRSLRVTLEDLKNDGGKRPDVDRGRLVVAYCT